MVMRLGLSRSRSVPERLSIFVCLGWLVLLLGLLTPLRAPASVTPLATPLPLEQGWHYRWGDSPLTAAGTPAWAEETVLGPAWQSLELPGTLAVPAGTPVVWLAVRLPETPWPQPSLHVRDLPDLLDLYLQGDRFLVGRELDAAGNLLHSEGYFPIVPLPSGYPGQLLFARIATGGHTTIALGGEGLPTLGSQADLVRQLVLADAMRLAFGFLFLFCGLFPLVVALSKQADKTYVSFGVVSLLIGLYTMSPTQLVRLLFGYGLSWTYVHHAAFHLLPASICFFSEQIFGPGPRRLLRRLWQLQLGYVPIALTIGSLLDWRLALYPTHLNILLMALTLMALAIARAHAGDREAKIFTWGLGAFLLAALYDLVVFLTSLALPNVQLFYWGMLIFVVGLAFILDRRFTQAQNHLKAYSAASDRFVPHEFLQFLGKESIIHVQLGDQVQQEMTVLFSDIRSFTTLSERMTPEQNFNFLNAYLHRVGPVIRKHHGFIDKYIGDAVMALFPHSADDAVRAAIEMQQQVRQFNRDYRDRGYPEIAIGIGLHHGSLMLGTIGEQERMESTVIADAVNLASRLEDCTKRFGVNVLLSEATLARLADPNCYLHRFLGSIRVKGKQESVGVFEIYEADPPALQVFKTQTRRQFEEAIRLYNAGQCEEAAVIFQRLWQKGRQDAALNSNLQLCQAAVQQRQR